MKQAYKKAFTLVEIMIVVLIIGILAGIAVPNFIKARESARTKSCVRNIRTMEASVEQYMMENRMQDSNSLPSGDPAFLIPNYIKVMPECPSDNSTAGYWIVRYTNGFYSVNCDSNNSSADHNTAAGN
jgi:prepilin-type N-terminal cleavage/methylation domain-containing protein